MKSFLRFLYLAALMLSPAHLLHAASIPDGLYEVRGTNSVHGIYSGQARIRGSEVERIIDFNSFKFKPAYHFATGPAEFGIQSVWTGKMNAGIPRFALSLSTVLTSYQGFNPSVEEINKTTFVEPTSESNDQNLVFEIPGEGKYQETWTRIGEASAAPLWKSERHVEEGLGSNAPFVVQLAKIAGINKAIQWYRSNPATEPYRQREEFKNEEQYFYTDRTDADFYAKNQNVLRIANRTLNPLAFGEALMRRNAYAPSLKAKADLLLADMLKYNFNATGVLEIATLDEARNKIGRAPEYDSGLWTAMFGWAELLRFQTTGNLEAKEHFLKVLDAALIQVEITGDPKEFARTFVVSPAGEDLGVGFVQGIGSFSQYKWRTGGNNDMLKGILVTLSLAHQLDLSSSPALQSRVRKIASALPSLKIANDGDYNEAMAYALSALWNEDHAALEKYQARLNSFRAALGRGLQVDTGFYYGGIADWSGIQLTMVSTISEIVVEGELRKVFTATEDLVSIASYQEAAETRLLAMQKTYKPAHRDFLTIMAFAYSRAARFQDGFKAEANDALWTLKEVPAPRSVGAGVAELSKRQDWSLSAWPRVPWKAIKSPFVLRKDLDFKEYESGVYSYPHFETNAWESVYLWKDSAFSVRFASNPLRQTFSSDYLLVYWAARKAGLLSAED